VNKLIEFPIRHPWLVIGSFVIVALAFALPTFSLKQIADVSVIVNPGMKEMVLRDQMEAIYGNSNFVIVAVEDAFNKDTLEKIADVTRRLEAIESVKEVRSVFNTQHIEGGSGAFEVGDLLETSPQSTADIEALETKLAQAPLYRGNLQSLGGTALSIMAEFDAGTDDEEMFQTIQRVLDEVGAGEAWTVSGLPIINTEVKHYMDADFRLLLPLFFVFIAIVLYLSFRSARGVFVPFASITFSIIVAMGSMAIADVPLNVVTNVMPMVLVAITSATGIHYLTRFYMENEEGLDREEVVRRTTLHVTRIVFLAAFTTFLAFMSNAFNDVKAVREFGIFAAIGVAASVIATLMLSPAILTLLPKAKERLQPPEEAAETHTLMDRFLRWIGDFVVFTPARAAFACLVVLGALAVKIVDVQADYTALGFFDDDSPIVTDARAVSRGFGGINGFDIDIDTGQPEGLLRADVIRTLDEFEHWIKEKYADNVKVTVTFADYVKQMNKAYNDGDDAFYRVPPSDDEVYQYVEVYSWSGSVEEDLRSVVTPDYRRTRVHGRFALQERPDGSWEESGITFVNAVIKDAVAWFEARLPEATVVQAYGVLPMWKQVQADIITGQFQSIALAIGTIMIVVMIVFRSISAGIIGMIPVTLSVVAIFGVMGWTGIKLEIGTSLVAAVAIGWGIEDTLHYMFTYRSNLARGLDPATAVRNTFRLAGRAMLYTSFALFAGYSILLLSNFKVIQYFAVLNLVAVVATTLGALIVLPLSLLFAQKHLGVRI
jgi:uncharacterized protein